MVKRYWIENLGCANCAAKMEAQMNRLEGVQVTLTFATRQLQVSAREPEAILPQLQRIVSSIEPQARIVAGRQQNREGSGHSHSHRRDSTLLWLLVGAGLFVLGLVLEQLTALWLWLPVYVAAYGLLGWQVLARGVGSLCRGRALDEHFLMSIATLGAFAIRAYPEAVGVMLFFRIGAYFEAKAVARSRSQILEAVDLRPETVLLANGKRIAARLARVGDLIRIRPGDRVGLDGTVVRGESSLDTASITGESQPVWVKPGDPVISGCINGSGQLTVRVEKVLEDSMVSRILRAVESAAEGKPRMDRLISRFARIYTPVVVAAAVVIALVPSLITGSWNYWVYTALSFLVMSCPCALVLSVPLAFFSGIGAGGRKGILFKGGSAIEALAAVRQVALDKTGTLTEGRFQVQRVVGPQGLLELCAACERNSTHPIAAGILAAAATDREATDLEEFPGCGVRARLEGKTILCGNEALMARFQVAIPAEQEVGTKVHVAEDGRYLGYILLSDRLKPDARAAVEQLHRQGLTTTILTGDEAANARQVAEQARIRQVYARLLPQEKLAQMQQLRAQGGSVLFVGDGINDAPVLAGADVGAAMGSGADAAIQAADVVYLTAQTQAIPQSIALARRTRRIVWQNVIFALGIKAAVMALGLLGYASMWLAVLADSGVAMLCVLNSIRQLYQK